MDETPQHDCTPNAGFLVMRSRVYQPDPLDPSGFTKNNGLVKMHGYVSVFTEHTQRCVLRNNNKGVR